MHAQVARDRQTAEQIAARTRAERNRRKFFRIDLSTENPDPIDFGDMDVECSSWGALLFLAERKVGCYTTNPQFAHCCSSGKITADDIGLLSDPPALLRELLTGDTSRDKRFRKSIRAYNNALSMGSVGAKVVDRGPGRSGVQPDIGSEWLWSSQYWSLTPPEGVRPSFLSVYIYDTDFAAQSETRAQNVPRVDPALLTQLAEMLSQCYTYIQTFSSLQELAHAEGPGDNYEIVIHADKRPAAEHERRYNGPSCSEAAAFIPGIEDGLVGKEIS